ncbi:MAG: tRNA lysidine(34) synthetase TilS [Thermodesulfobacteriota bacterium]
MLLHRVKRTIDHYDLLNQGDRLVVGVSAGVDSMVLLHLLDAFRQTFDLSLIVAHINHGIRPKDAEQEADFVRNECERLRLPFEYEKFDAKEYQRVAKLSLQGAARRLRFHFFEQVLQKYDAQKIALGHHADDQVETILLRLMRGAGLQGLKGMLPIREGKVIRPLLEVWRHEIEAFAIKNKIPFLVDSSNLKEDYMRNRVRLSLIPLLEKEYQPNFRRILVRTSAILREENDYLEKEAERAWEAMVEGKGELVTFQYALYRSLHPAIQWRVIQRMLRRIYGEEKEDLEISEVFRKLKQAPASFLLELPLGVCLEKRYGTVSLEKKRVEATPPFEVELVSPGRTFIKEIGREVVTEEMGMENRHYLAKGSPDTAFLDYHVLRFPLRVRNFRPGDRFQPFGVKGSQKLKEFFIDHKVPRFERSKIPLLISGERIAWVVGHRIGDFARMTESTKRILKVKFS